MVLVAANEIIQSGDYTSGLERRRLTMWFNNQIPRDRQRNLIELTPDGLTGEFVDFIPGLLNWVLELSDDEITNYVKRTEQFVPTLSAKKSQVLCDTNPLADWVDHCIVYRPNTRTQIGVAKRDKSPESLNCYQLIDQWLYASYAEYSVATGNKAISSRRFSNLLHDLLVNQLKIKGIEKGKDRNGAYFLGIAIRHDDDPDELLITGVKPVVTRYPNPQKRTPSNFDTQSSSVKKNVTQVTKTVTKVTENCHSGEGGVTAETPVSDGSDASDGFFSNLAPDKKEIGKNESDENYLVEESPQPINSVTSITGNGSSHHPTHHSVTVDPSQSDSEGTTENSGDELKPGIEFWLKDDKNDRAEVIEVWDDISEPSVFDSKGRAIKINEIEWGNE